MDPEKVTEEHETNEYPIVDGDVKGDRLGTARVDLDAEFGGYERRKELEKKLLRKVDLRMSILVVIYILNYVRFAYCAREKA
jgi:hypothetical protein